MNIIYLGGNMTPTPDYYNDWTERFARKIDIGEWKSEYGYKVTIAKDKGDAKMIVHHDLARLKKSDILVVNIGLTDLNHHLTGMIVEVYEAFKQNKPVYTFYESGYKPSVQSNSPWFDQFITKSFGSMEEITHYLLTEEDIP